MVKGEWTFPVEDLGEALFDFVEIEASDLESAGVLNVDPTIIAALRVNRYEVSDERIAAQVELVFQRVALEQDEARTTLDVACARDAVPFLRQIGSQVCHAYEKARAILSNDAG
jgi:hypothetical protein